MRPAEHALGLLVVAYQDPATLADRKSDHRQLPTLVFDLEDRRCHLSFGGGWASQNARVEFDMQYEPRYSLADLIDHSPFRCRRAKRSGLSQS